MDISELFQSILLGVVEGLTEFIPVSSTGHLILLIDLIGFKGPPGKAFEIIIQLGAILAVCWIYRKKIFQILIGLTNSKKDQLFALNICLAFFPAAILGVMFHGFIKNVLFQPVVVAVALIVGGVAIIFIEKRSQKPCYNSIDKIQPKTALCIGFLQSLAMIPGVSRSGATIMGSILLGVDRKAATEFSFFLAIPTMLGATIYDVYKNYATLSVDNIDVILVGFISAFISAMLVVRTLINFISNNGFTIFGWYRIILGSAMIVLILLGYV